MSSRLLVALAVVVIANLGSSRRAHADEPTGLVEAIPHDGSAFDLESNERAPNRYHVEKRRRVGLIAGGIAMALGSHALYCVVINIGSTAGAAPAGAYVPVVGPFVLSQYNAALAAWSLPQLGGIAMMTIGLLARKRVAVPDRLAVVPAVDPARGEAGLRAFGAF